MTADKRRSDKTVLSVFIGVHRRLTWFPQSYEAFVKKIGNPILLE
jgi:hypothetical protein